ncbi:MAG: phosphoserine phosphatase SerB [Proteobacteria bacterium]|nr:phosphoserine phosphatase SerB [Pseudomonadota bacterium]MDA1059103.1 phosphoserine phosphatase SerB [Pseudomonadota bacterium]
MTAVVTLIADPTRRSLDDDVLASLGQALADAGFAPAPPVWLSPGEAVDIAVARADVAVVRPVAEVALDGMPIDVAVQPQANRRKRLLVADMDSTIIGQECIDELAAALGLREEVSAITERAMRGEIEFAAALRERAAMLAGLGPDEMEAVLRDRITLNLGAHTLVATMRKNGAFTALVSGGFTFFTSRIRARAGFDMDQANVLLTDDEGKLTGLVAEPVLGRAAKREALQALTAARGFATAETMAVGDGANDLAMIEAAGLGVAFRAKPAVAEQADVRITHGDLTALLFLQGYQRAEFITPT